jgi:CYTH domain-containing protein
MPLEREFKYILSNDQTLIREIESMEGARKSEIKQGYLGKGGRVRQRVWQDTKQIENIFTYKVDLKNQPGCLEIEKELSDEDFTLSWNQVTHKIFKTRYVVPDQGGYWEIDFFKDHKGVYFVMAEFEKLDGPPEMHPMIKRHLIHEVLETDRNFKNRKLSSRAKVKKLMKKYQ